MPRLLVPLLMIDALRELLAGLNTSVVAIALMIGVVWLFMSGLVVPLWAYTRVLEDDETPSAPASREEAEWRSCYTEAWRELAEISETFGVPVGPPPRATVLESQRAALDSVETALAGSEAEIAALSAQIGDLASTIRVRVDDVRVLPARRA